MMSIPRQGQRALMLRVDRQAMIARGPEPEFPVAALAEAQNLAVPSAPFGARMIRTIQNGRIARGDHVLTWDNLDAEGRSMSAGTYFIRAESGEGMLRTRVVRVE